MQQEKGLWDKTKEVSSNIWESTKDVTSNVWEGTKNLASDVKDSFTSEDTDDELDDIDDNEDTIIEIKTKKYSKNQMPHHYDN